MMSHRVKYIFKEWIEPLITGLILALILRFFVIQAFKIPTGSMEPTLHGDTRRGDRILVFKPIYWFREPYRGEVIVFKYPEDPKKAFIKRLVAEGNETVEIRNGNIVINDRLITDMDIFLHIYYTNNEPYGQEGVPVTVPENHFYVLGDNSLYSKDSRKWGFVPRKYLIGKAVLIWWPPKRIGLIK